MPESTYCAAWLKDHTHLLHEHAVGYLLLKCLYLEMEGKTREMRRAARAGYALKSVQDLAEAGRKKREAQVPVNLVTGETPSKSL